MSDNTLDEVAAEIRSFLKEHDDYPYARDDIVDFIDAILWKCTDGKEGEGEWLFAPHKEDGVRPVDCPTPLCQSTPISESPRYCPRCGTKPQPRCMCDRDNPELSASEQERIAKENSRREHCTQREFGGQDHE